MSAYYACECVCMHVCMYVALVTHHIRRVKLDCQFSFDKSKLWPAHSRQQQPFSFAQSFHFTWRADN